MLKFPTKFFGLEMTPFPKIRPNLGTETSLTDRQKARLPERFVECTCEQQRPLHHGRTTSDAAEKHSSSFKPTHPSGRFLSYFKNARKLWSPKFAVCVTGERTPHYQSSQDFQNLLWGVTPKATSSVFWSHGMIPYLDYPGLPTFQNPILTWLYPFKCHFSCRQFNLIFNPEDSTVEMSDNRSRKTFLKKTITTEVLSRGVYFLNRNICRWIQGMCIFIPYDMIPFPEG